MAPAVKATGQRVAITIATDGMPTNEEGYGGEDQRQTFVKALRMLEGLPVWVVIRLCTDDKMISDLYNNLDASLELSVDVLDDFTAEAEEIHEHDHLFDLIDERPFIKSEVRDYCATMFGESKMDGVPDPSMNILESSLGEN
jgi:hypothetical protein